MGKITKFLTGAFVCFVFPLVICIAIFLVIYYALDRF